MEIAADLGYSVVEKTLRLYDVYTADEAFFTGSEVEVTPIASIDGRAMKYEYGDLTFGKSLLFLRSFREIIVSWHLENICNLIAFF